jgi:hypothetical protein
MKSILMASALLMSAIAFGQEKRPPEPKAEGQSAEQSQSSGQPQGEAIINLSDVISKRIDVDTADRARLPFGLTKHPLMDKEGLCKVHHEKLTRAMVPMLFGLRPGPPYSKETEQKLFPNALTSVDGGCLVGSVKVAIVMQCQKCIEAKKKWFESRQ